MGVYEPKELSPRHKEVLRMLATGMSQRDIAKVFGISEWTVSRVKRSEKGRQFLDQLDQEMNAYARRSAAITVFGRLL